MGIYLKNVEKPLTVIGTFTDKLNNGITMDQLQQTLETLNLEDGNALAQQAACCSNCCSGNTITIGVPSQSLTEDRPSYGKPVQIVNFKFTLP